MSFLPASTACTATGRGTMLSGNCMVFSSSPVMPTSLTISASLARAPESSMMPDDDAREGMFRIYLGDRPCSDDIDFGRLASLTKNFIASEIAFVCNQAALEASHTNSDINEKLMEKVVRQTTPRTTPDTLRYYEKMRKRMENIREEHRSIGFT